MTTYLTESRSLSVVVVDFNNDNQMDIAVANGDSKNVGIFLGSGNGSFQSQSVALGDFDKNDQIDLVVANSAGNTISILLGHSNETFTSQVTYSTSIYPFPIAVAGVNKLYIAVVNRDSNTVSMQNVFKAGTNPFSVTVASLNSYMIEDIVLGNVNGQSVGVFLYKCLIVRLFVENKIVDK